VTNKLISIVVIGAVVDLCSVLPAAAQSAIERENPPARTVTTDPFLLGPPKKDRPIVVRANFQLHNINEINEQAETFAFSGVLTLEWRDERQAFDPAAAGVDEKVYLGAYQFNELATGWFPQVVLVNEAGAYDKHGTMLRVQPDGTQTLVETLNAVAKTELNMRRFPLDRQRLEAVFEVLGYDASEVVLRAEGATQSPGDTVRIPQWSIEAIGMSTRERSAPYAGRRGVASALVMSIDVQRESFFITRLVVAPLIVIVLLSFSVFWMDRSALGDRVSVSFIGILTGVAYQLVMSEILPRISYVTLVHGIISLSFFAMCGAVVVNLAVGALDRNNKSDLADRIDRRCRWIFPLAYFGLLFLILGVALLFF
jgi:hypothetical protein